MKPLSELVKEFRRFLASEEGKQVDAYRYGQASGHRICADLLEAWLREAHKQRGEFYEDYGRDGFKYNRFIRDELLGTTQSSGVSRKRE